MKKLDFEKDLSIDKFRLDDECVTHSGLYHRYSEMEADAKNQVGILADNLKLKMGEANIGIRNAFTKKELKFTEAVISAEVEKNDNVLEAREELREAELNLSRLQAGVRAFEHRKSQLDNLVKLYCAGYFSMPGNGKPKDTINEQASRKARSGLNRSRNKKPSVDDEDDE